MERRQLACVSDNEGLTAKSSRRVVRPTLARAIEYAFANSPAALRRATFSLGRGSARVHVILQTKGERVMLIALCRPALRPVVIAALRDVRLNLAARGIEVESRGLGVPTCS